MRRSEIEVDARNICAFFSLIDKDVLRFLSVNLYLFLNAGFRAALQMTWMLI